MMLNSYIPVGDCPVCHYQCFLDGIPGDFRVRPHWTQDVEVRRQRQAQAAAAGKRYYELPNCRGSGRKPIASSVQTPDVYFATGVVGSTG